MSNDKREVGGIRVRVLTLSDCDYCMWLKSELDAEGIIYDEIDAYKFSEFADVIENRFKTNSYPIVFIDLPAGKTTTVVSETSLELSDTLRIFNTIPELIGIIKSYLK